MPLDMLLLKKKIYMVMVFFKWTWMYGSRNPVQTMQIPTIINLVVLKHIHIYIYRERRRKRQADAEKEGQGVANYSLL